MSDYNMTELVKGHRVSFQSFRQGVFYYILTTIEDVENGMKFTDYQFGVPLDDIGTATLKAQDKAITFMRWIRKAIEDKTFICLGQYIEDDNLF